MKHKRVLLKLSGEIFGDNNKPISLQKAREIAERIIKFKKQGNFELAIVIGGGNIFRGREKGDKKFDQTVADNIGMLSTIINGLALAESLENLGAKAKILTAIDMKKIAESFKRDEAAIYLKKNILIFAAGTGNPFFSTDTASALRACEIGADIILKATDVNGVYNKDPDKFKDAKMYKKLSYNEAIEKNLKVMDSTAFTLCKDNKIPIIVFNIKDLEKINDVLKNKLGTIVYV